MDFLIATEDLHRTSWQELAPPRPREGQALLAVERFGLSTNNVTYAAFGEAMSYWRFFPAPEGWGRMPVWGFATVAASRVEGLPEGARLYGYLPPSSELLVSPARVDAGGFLDASAHRAGLPAAYNGYQRTDADPAYSREREDQQMLLRPLFFTSWLIDDFLRDARLFGAETVIVSSASSKTASALAFLLSRGDAVEVLGLTSRRGERFARSLGVYGEVLTYEQLDALPDGPAVYVDIAGDAGVRSAVHARVGSRLAHSAVVGATHHDRLAAGGEPLPGPRPTFFFAPERASRRSADWGRQGLERRLAEAWAPYVEWTDGWLRVTPGAGPEAVERVYLELLDGAADPAAGHVLSLAEPR